jgi:hypothetical protein
MTTSGVAHVLPDQVVAGGADQVAAPQVAQVIQDLGHAQRDRGLARAGAAGEAHVQRGAGGLQAEAGAEPVDQEQGGDLADPGLDRVNADEFGVEAVEDTGDRELVLPGAQVDQRVVGEGFVVGFGAGAGLDGGRRHREAGHPGGSP